MSNKHLNYIIYNYPTEVTLDIFEAEKYEPAIVIQPMVGNLVYYSNHGRYEPRIASKWERSKPNTWTFYLKEGFTCENGEAITAQGFKKSLERMLLSLSKKGDSPVLNRLVGYQDFLKSGVNLEGLTALGNQLTFHFSQPLRGGLIEVLSFAPYGYICSENLKADGTWKDKSKFVSSGPYSISDYKPGDQYVLSLRNEWSKIASPNAPKTVTISHKIKSEADTESMIIDSINPVKGISKDFSILKLVPEYLNAVLLGNLETGYFSNISNRIAFKHLIEEFRKELPEQFKINYRTNSFYSTSNVPPPTYAGEKFELSTPQKALVIEGTEPTPDSFKYETWITLEKALKKSGLKYQFAGNEQKWHNIRSGEYDIRLRCTSVGGSADAWGLDILFCSTIGPGYPDPNKRICSLIKRFESDVMSEKEFEYNFLEAIDKDAAIIPISHMGSQLFLGSKIRTSSVSPALNIMRFDQLELD